MLLAGTWMDPEIILEYKYYTKGSTSDRKRQIYGITYMWNLKNNTNEYKKKNPIKQTHKQKTNLCLTKEKGGGKE